MSSSISWWISPTGCSIRASASGDDGRRTEDEGQGQGGVMAQSGTLTASTERATLPERSVGRGRALWQRLRRSKGALVGLTILALLAVVSLIAPFIPPFDPIKVTDNTLFSPGSPYLFGTDQYGRDIASRIIYGA